MSRRLSLLWNFVLVLVFLLAAGMLSGLQADGVQLQDRSLTISDSRPSQTAMYKFSFRPVGLQTIQTLVLQICSNDPFPGTPCTAPNGFDATNAQLVSQAGDQGFSISPSSTANEIVLSRPPLVTNDTTDTYVFSNIVNPSDKVTYFGRLQAFADSDTNGTAVYYGGLAFQINDGVSINVTVPPYLLFCVGVVIVGTSCDNATGNYVQFGALSSRSASVGSTQMLAASNAKNGYIIWVDGTTMTSGVNTIPALTSPSLSRPGVSQFGMNLRANTSPQIGLDPSGLGSGTPTAAYDQPNNFVFNPGDTIATTTQPDETRTYTASYIVNVQSGQAPGVYVSTLTYGALGSY